MTEISQKCILHFNSAWLKAIQLHQVAWLLREPELLENIYVLESKDAEAVNPSPQTLPWFVVLLLGSCSRKHIFQSRLPPLKVFSRSIQDACNRLKWQFHFRDCPSDKSDRLKIRRRVKEYHKSSSLPIELTWCCKNLSDRLLEQYKSAKRIFESRRILGEGVPSFVYAALKWLQRNRMKSALSDKDGVFVLVTNDVYESLKSDQLNKVWYERIAPDYMSKHSLVQAASSIISNLSKFVSPVIINDMRSSVFDTSSRHTCRWGCTIKTHKPAGEVCARPLHSSVGHLLGGLSAWIDLVLSSILLKKSFVSRSSKHVLESLKDVRVTTSTCFCKADIKDFYMNGEHRDLCEACVSTVRRELDHGHVFPGMLDESTFAVDKFSEVLGFVLFHQYVDAEQEGVLYRVCVGSGMGLKHSPSVSSINFYHLVERRLLEESRDVELLAYTRYHDDILMVITSAKHAKRVFEKVQGSASKCYRVLIDEVSMVGVAMLDLFVYKGERFREYAGLDWRPYIKATSRHIPLSQHSAHLRSVHSSWPPAEISRMHMLSLHREDFEHFKQIKIRRFEQFGLDPKVLDRCRSWLPIPKSKIAQEMCLVKQGKHRLVRCILPFHEHLCSGIVAVQSAVQHNWDLLLGNCLSEVRLQFGWANHARPLSLVLRNHKL